VLVLQGLGWALLTLGGLIALLNWFSLYWTWHTGRFSSAVPLIGGVLLTGGILLLPGGRPYAWMGALADYGTLVCLVALPLLFQQFWETSRYNLLEEYVGEQRIKTVRLRLFGKAVFTIEQHFRRNPDECGVAQVGTVGTWERLDGRIRLQVGDHSVEFETLTEPGSEGLRQVAGTLGYEAREELSLAGIILRKFVE
jgi:hypothetical protein